MSGPHLGELDLMLAELVDEGLLEVDLSGPEPRWRATEAARREAGPCPHCGGARVRCCEFGSDR